MGGCCHEQLETMPSEGPGLSRWCDVCELRGVSSSRKFALNCLSQFLPPNQTFNPQCSRFGRDSRCRMCVMCVVCLRIEPPATLQGILVPFPEVLERGRSGFVGGPGGQLQSKWVTCAARIHDCIFEVTGEGEHCPSDSEDGCMIEW